MPVDVVNVGGVNVSSVTPVPVICTGAAGVLVTTVPAAKVSVPGVEAPAAVGVNVTL